MRYLGCNRSGRRKRERERGTGYGGDGDGGADGDTCGDRRRHGGLRRRGEARKRKREESLGPLGLYQPIYLFEWEISMIYIAFILLNHPTSVY